MRVKLQIGWAYHLNDDIWCRRDEIRVSLFVLCFIPFLYARANVIRIPVLIVPNVDDEDFHSTRNVCCTLKQPYHSPEVNSEIGNQFEPFWAVSFFYCYLRKGVEKRTIETIWDSRAHRIVGHIFVFCTDLECKYCV